MYGSRISHRKTHTVPLICDIKPGTFWCRKVDNWSSQFRVPRNREAFFIIDPPKRVKTSTMQNSDGDFKHGNKENIDQATVRVSSNSLLWNNSIRWFLMVKGILSPQVVQIGCWYRSVRKARLLRFEWEAYQMERHIVQFVL